MILDGGIGFCVIKTRSGMAIVQKVYRGDEEGTVGLVRGYFGNTARY
jgi:hypothetical protein